MFQTCIFCHSKLGRNESIENFPVGRRLAFDSNKGRLWAVCSKCGRWNLTPIEERWEAIEECERQYRVTPKRASTDEIGLGRLKEGTDLIRIGKPLRPEFASWRYAGRMTSRATTGMIGAAIGVAGFLTAFTGVGAFVGPLIGSIPIASLAYIRHSDVRAGRKYLRRRASMIAGRRIIDDKQIDIRLVPKDDELGWGLRFYGFTMPKDLVGGDALHTLQKVMPAINVFGGSRGTVRKAVAEIEEAGAPEAYFNRVIQTAIERRETYMPIQGLPSVARLAIEMASNEEVERRALVEGELKQLEEDWREAEEIAAIADNLLIPGEITRSLEDLRRRS